MAFQVKGKYYPSGDKALKALSEYGCLHYKTGVLLGISPSRYTKEELKKIQAETKEIIEFDGKKHTLYEWKQVQRRMELQTRNEMSVSKLYKASGDKLAAKQHKERVMAYLNKYDELVNGVPGLEDRRDRMRVFEGSRRAKTIEKITSDYSNKKLTNGGKGGIININKDTINFSYPMKGFDNKSIREWYVANVGDIQKRIDTSKSLEEQARQAFDLRNKYRHIARIHMSDISTAKMLEKEHPSKTFDELLKEKMLRKGLTKQEALEDILKTSSKTNSSVNKEFGL